jgi:aromatic-L-amino-acid decarboxylase
MPHCVWKYSHRTDDMHRANRSGPSENIDAPLAPASSPTPPAEERGPLGDMPADEFRAAAHRVADWIADYLEGVESYPVLSESQPGQVARSQATEPPRRPVPFEQIVADFEATVIPGITHWNHPGFFAYFGISGAGPGVLAEAIVAALNVNAMMWHTSPAATELEEVSLGWLARMLGLPEIFRGHIQDTASTSTMVALAAAREAAGLDVRREGLSGRDLPRLRVYCSREAHSSVDKAAITLGFGLAGVARVETDSAFQLDPSALDLAIRRDLEAGIQPLCVVGTIGTTSTTSVDPIDRIAEICAEHRLWLHVDAAYGGAAALLPEMRGRMAGWERANSIVVNPHKWLFVPLDCSALFFRDPTIARRTYALVPDYLASSGQGAVSNLMELGPALGRRFRALKLWMTLRYFGQSGLEQRLREHLRLARLFADWIEETADWELLAPVRFSTVCFRFRPGDMQPGLIDRLNEALLERVNSSGEVFMSHTRLRGEFVMRLAIGNIRTQERHVARAWELLRSTAENLRDSERAAR